MSSLRLFDTSMDVYRKQAAPYSEECLKDAAKDCANSVNINCDACYLYRTDALPFVKTFDFRVADSSSSPEHQLVSIGRLGHFFSGLSQPTLSDSSLSPVVRLWCSGQIVYASPCAEPQVWK